MTAADGVLVAALALALLAWCVRRLPGRDVVVALAALVSLGAGLYGAWDQRWQDAHGALAGGLCLLALALGRWRRARGRRPRPLLSGLLLGLVVAVALAAVVLFPVDDLPAPDGPFAVGVRDFELVDHRRTGVLQAAPGEPRRLLVRVWYPADPAPGARPRAYFDAAEARSTARGFGEVMGFAPMLAYLAHVGTHGYPDAPLRAAAGRLPVVLFSHGYAGYAGSNTVLMERLASHGYAVYAVQHSGDASPTRLPSGAVEPMDPGLVEHLRQALADGLPPLLRRAYTEDDLDVRLDAQLRVAREIPAPANRALWTSAPVWLADRLFVHDALQAGAVPASVAEVVAASALARVGEMGMSFGGSTAGAVCQVDRRCAALVNLDGGDFHFTPFAADVPVPLLMIHADLRGFYRMLGATPPATPRSFNDFSYERLDATGLRPSVHRLVLRDSLHAGLTDNGLFVRRPLRDLLFGSAPGAVLTGVPNAFVLAFFDHYLRGLDNGFPEVQYRRYGDWVQPYDTAAVRHWWLAKPPAERAALQQRIDDLHAWARAPR